MIHSINIIIHVIAGTIALIIGVVTISFYNRPKAHRYWGRYFLYLLSVVVVTGFGGWLFFRSDAFLLMLTLLSGYVGYTGYRAIKLREKRATWVDAILSAVAIATGVLYVVSLQQKKDWSPVVVYSTLSALMLVTIYDLLKFFWLHHRIKNWWLYEHIYKMISAFSALLSAFSGSVLWQFKPFSQVGPSALGVVMMLFFITQQVRLRNRRHSEKKSMAEKLVA